MLVALFALLSLLLSPPVEAACSRAVRRTVTPSPGTSSPAFCVLQASQTDAQSFLELDNGSCLLLHACTQPQTDHPAPIFKLVRPESSGLVLLRTRTEDATNPYSFLLDSKAENATQEEESALQGSRLPYKSPLIQAAYDIPVFSHVDLVLANSSGTFDAKLSFKVASSGLLDREASWFSSDRLIAASPWKVADMSSGGALLRKSVPLLGIKFLVYTFSVVFDICNGAVGYIAVYEKLRCSSFNTKYPVNYIWARDGDDAGNFGNRRTSLEFRLHGRLHPLNKVRFYRRR